MSDFLSNLELYHAYREVKGTNAPDLSGNGRAGTLTNSPTLQSGAGVLGLLLSGASSQYIATSYPGITGTGAITTIVRAKTTDTNAATTASPLINWGTAATAAQWLMAIQNGVFWGRFVSVTASFGSGFNDGNIHTVAMTKPASGTGSQVKGYVDGAPLTGTYTGGATTINVGTTFPVNLGTQPANGVYFNGTIYDGWVYSRELTATDIADHYAAFGLHKHWQLDEAA